MNQSNVSIHNRYKKGACSYINGAWSIGSTELKTFNPADTSKTVGEFSEASGDEILRAAHAARSASKMWAKTPAPVRGGIIGQFGALVSKNKEALANILTQEIGKPHREALGSVQEVIDTCVFFASEGRRLYGQTVPSEMPLKELFTYRRPIGVFGCITAGNFPVAVPAWYFVPALVAGNTCVWKPSEDSLLTSYFFTELLHHSGVPKGVFNTVFGNGPTAGAKMVQMINDGHFDKFGFTGSTEVGRQIGETCGRNLQVPCLELGGKNPLIICEDANLDLALDGVVFSGFGTAGQRCTSLGNLILHENIYDKFLVRLIDRVKTLRIGDPTQSDIDYGPMISEKFMNNHLSDLRNLVTSKHQLPLGPGGRIGHGVGWDHFSGNSKNGLYARPNIVVGVEPHDKIYSSETFGPIFNILKCRNLDEALDLANGTGYGLSSSIYTNNPSYVYKFKSDISAGMCSINNSTTGAEAHLPFGGNGKSGNGGRQSGIWVLDTFTKWQAVNWDMSGHLQLAQMDTPYVAFDEKYRI